MWTYDTYCGDDRGSLIELLFMMVAVISNMSFLLLLDHDVAHPSPNDKFSNVLSEALLMASLILEIFSILMHGVT